jgi:hypothetical protein
VITAGSGKIAKGTTNRRLAWILEIIPGHLANLTLHIGVIFYGDRCSVA